ncbi:hypothetical protein [Amycolatopsis cihanbeyliensis]|uniref:Uncharacterized protein n=1 Tax=Amycolatopsis cihanbeyliensis TaxID=1128664 RepID=A0A542CTY1_AMYCI|nr:hypothetical protein [Amycolatopsis cihanbeyliensis]TQI94279.1 hypothetical protein FB471_6441 [Amycolatopsis cihanbeyliensis]
MEQLASDAAVMLLVGTPFLIFAKIVHGLATRRVSLAPRGSRGARAELVVWSLIAAVDSHTLALWSSVANQPEDLCAPYRPAMGADVYLDGGYFLDYPVEVRCVWPDGGSVNVVPWPLNVATALLFVTAVAIAAHAGVRAYRRRRARHHTTP